MNKDAYRARLEFREKMSPTLLDIRQQFALTNVHIEQVGKCLEAMKNLEEAWDELLKAFRIDAEVEEGICKKDHPASRFPETVVNMERRLMRKVYDLEGEIAKIKEYL